MNNKLDNIVASNEAKRDFEDPQAKQSKDTLVDVLSKGETYKQVQSLLDKINNNTHFHFDLNYADSYQYYNLDHSDFLCGLMDVFRDELIYADRVDDMEDTEVSENDLIEQGVCFFNFWSEKSMRTFAVKLLSDIEEYYEGDDDKRRNELTEMLREVGVEFDTVKNDIQYFNKSELINLIDVLYSYVCIHNLEYGGIIFDFIEKEVNSSCDDAAFLGCLLKKGYETGYELSEYREEFWKDQRRVRESNAA